MHIIQQERARQLATLNTTPVTTSATAAASSIPPLSNNTNPATSAAHVRNPLIQTLLRVCIYIYNLCSYI